MTQRLLALASGAFAATLFVLSARSATAGGQAGALVRLQATTPGSAQTGHANLTGTLRAGQFVGGGAGVTSVNADLLDGLNSTAFLQGVPNPLNLSGSQSGSHIISATNSSTTTASSAIKGFGSAASGTNYGIYGTNSSINGRGVFGEATASSGLNYGGRFESSSTSGRAVFGFSIATSGSTYGLSGQVNSDTGRAVYGLANSSTGVNYGGYFSSTSNGGYGVFATSDGPYGLYASSTQTSGTAYGVFGTSAAFTGYGVYGEATSGTGSNWGGRFSNSSTSGGGVYGSAQSTTGSTIAGRFEANSTSGRGVFGWATATSGNTYGVWGKSDSPTGRAVFADAAGAGTAGYFQSVSGEAIHGVSDGSVVATFISTTASFNQPKGIFAQSEYTGGEFDGGIYGVRGTGDSYGVYGSAQAASGVGVSGFSAGGSGVEGTGETGVAGFSGTFRGLWGDAFDNSGGTAYGVYGDARSNPGRGVYGVASNTFSGTGYGVRGVNSSPAGYGVYAVGDFGASGNKSFVIDHPLDPENKYLKHYCAEGPEPKNLYDGTVITDTSGWATVTLPDYFAEINKDPRVQLTVDDAGEDFVMVKVVGGVQKGQFRLRTSKGGVKVYWEVKATRNDLWNQAHGAPVEVLKDPAERGKYQHPELYGQPKELAVDYDLRAERARKKEKNPR